MIYDNNSSTVDGAMAFAKMHAEYYDENPGYCNENNIDEDFDDNDPFDNCNCSDPGCPCGGIKRGGV